jgi:hypothetical protein
MSVDCLTSCIALRPWRLSSWRSHGMGSDHRRGWPTSLFSRAAVVVGVLLLVQPVHAAEPCVYSCTMIRWGAKNLSRQKIAEIVVRATPAQVAACRQCLTNNKP